LNLLAIAAAFGVGAPVAEAQGRPLFIKLVDEDSGATIEGEVHFEERTATDRMKPGPMPHGERGWG
jgi:hypothetical protein